MSILIALLTAVIGGTLFQLAHLPIPWLLGPLIAVLIGSNLWRGHYKWPGLARNAGLVIVGYTIGLSLTAAALREMSRQLPDMLLLTVLLLLLCTGIAYVVSKLSGMDYRTILVGSVPGGLTQMIVLAEETEGVNVTVVTVIQVIRLMMIIVCVPLLVFSPILGQSHSTGADALAGQLPPSEVWHALLPNLPIFAAVCIFCAWGGNRIRFPTAYLLGPAIGTAVMQLCGLHGPALPTLVIDAAQFMIGTYVGLLLRPEQLHRKLRTLSLAIGSAIVLIAGSLGLSYLLTRIHPVSLPTALLSLAPGGMDQMGIIAHEVGADLSTVAGFQVFRTFFIFFAVPPLLRMLFGYHARRRRNGQG